MIRENALRCVRHIMKPSTLITNLNVTGGGCTSRRALTGRGGNAAQYDPDLRACGVQLPLRGYSSSTVLISVLRLRIGQATLWWKRIEAEGLATIRGSGSVLHEPAMMDAAAARPSPSRHCDVRDPGFYRVFRDQVVPTLRTYPFIRLWHAGCATGEEVFSMAMLLEEEGLYQRSRIYATDINEVVLQKAKAGIFPIDRMQEYTENYIAAGGKRAFSDYYVAKYGGALFSPHLTRNVVFSQHNLVTDSSFSEFNAILCRNVLIYFDKSLQARVHELFYNSLAMFAFSRWEQGIATFLASRLVRADKRAGKDLSEVR